MSGILVSYRGAPAALVGATRFSFLGDVRHLPPGHPDVRMVVHMSYYARLVLLGEMPGPYTDEDAERFARFALIEEEQLGRYSDQTLARRFGVPGDQVARARAERADGH